MARHLILNVERVFQPTDPLFLRSMEVYQLAFPPDVRRRPEDIAERFEVSERQTGRPFVWLVATVTTSDSGRQGTYKEVSGFACLTVFPVRALRFAWISYIVVREGFRHLGVYRDLKEKIREIVSLPPPQGYDCFGLVFETEMMDSLDPAELKEARDRLRIFQVNGARILAKVPYIQPKLHPDGNEVPLYLCYLPLRDRDANQVPSDLVKEVLGQIYNGMYFSWWDWWGKTGKLRPQQVQEIKQYHQALYERVARALPPRFVRLEKIRPEPEPPPPPPPTLPIWTKVGLLILALFVSAGVVYFIHGFAPTLAAFTGALASTVGIFVFIVLVFLLIWGDITRKDFEKLVRTLLNSIDKVAGLFSSR